MYVLCYPVFNILLVLNRCAMMNFQLERCKLQTPTEVRVAWIVLYIANTWAKCDDTIRLKYQQQQYIEQKAIAAPKHRNRHCNVRCLDTVSLGHRTEEEEEKKKQQTSIRTRKFAMLCAVCALPLRISSTSQKLNTSIVLNIANKGKASCIYHTAGVKLSSTTSLCSRQFCTCKRFVRQFIWENEQVFMHWVAIDVGIYEQIATSDALVRLKHIHATDALSSHSCYQFTLDIESLRSHHQSRVVLIWIAPMCHMVSSSIIFGFRFHGHRLANFN